MAWNEVSWGQKAILLNLDFEQILALFDIEGATHIFHDPLVDPYSSFKAEFKYYLLCDALSQQSG